jgi:hypothetical protein
MAKPKYPAVDYAGTISDEIKFAFPTIQTPDAEAIVASPFASCLGESGYQFKWSGSTGKGYFDVATCIRSRSIMGAKHSRYPKFRVSAISGSPPPPSVVEAIYKSWAETVGYEKWLAEMREIGYILPGEKPPKKSKKPTPV